MSRIHYTVDFCNGDNHGCFTGHVDAVEVYEHRDGVMEPLIEIRSHVFDEEAGEWIGLPFEYNRRGDNRAVSVTVGGKTFPILGGPNSGGNWSWDSVPMHLFEICRLLNHLKAARHRWPSGGQCQMFDMDQADEDFAKRWQDPARRFVARARAPRWFRAISRKRRRKFNRQSKRTRCLVYK